MAIKDILIGQASDGKPIFKRVNTKTQVSKENKQEYAHEKRMKELNKRGHNPDQIKGMMDSGRGKFRIKNIEKALRRGSVRLDGKL